MAAPPAPPPEDAQAPSNAALAKLEQEKELSFIKAWEESKKRRAENRAERKQAKVGEQQQGICGSPAEDSRGTIGEEKGRTRGEGEEQIHQKAEEKRAVVEVVKGQELLKAEERAAKYRPQGHLPNTLFKCFKH